MNLPEHICLCIMHNPHAGDYRTLEQWLDDQLVTAEAQGYKRDDVIRPEDLAAIRAGGDVWIISWSSRTPVGSCEVIAATLERALELANAG